MITYQAELNLFQTILSQFHLKIAVLPASSNIISATDLGLREKIYAGSFPDNIEAKFVNSLKDKIIYKITDEFSCAFVFMLLPEYEEKTVLVVGPYLTDEKDLSWIDRLIDEKGIDKQWTPVLENHFRTVPYLSNDKIITAAFNSLAERIWGIHQFSTEEIIEGIPDSFIPLSSPPDPQAQADILSAIRRIERTYDEENRLIEAVSQGRMHRVCLMFSNFSQATLENRTTPLRNIKNYSIILNTIMRKAVEKGGVHPIHIDKLSSQFARKIENVSDISEFADLWQDMGKKYCLLVKNHATINYSQLVQYIIARIDFDLTADLSLKANAAALNVNPSYLSTLFRKETGKTLTDYVNQKRVEHAVYLLASTDLPISAVGQRCGISDDNYFTKIFKKYTSITPKQYRQQKNIIR